jgi:hypothetical protein
MVLKNKLSGVAFWFGQAANKPEARLGLTLAIGILAELCTLALRANGGPCLALVIV